MNSFYMVDIKTLIPNKDNPRRITRKRMDALKRSISGFKKMMEVRPIIVDENNIVLAGNMRLKAIELLGMSEVPDSWVKVYSDFNAEEKKRFVAADNVSFGEFDMDIVSTFFSLDELEDIGFDMDLLNQTAIDLTSAPEPLDIESSFETCPECGQKIKNNK